MKDLKDRIDHFDNADYSRKFFDEIKDRSTKFLIDLLETTREREPYETKEDEIDVIQTLIQHKIGVLQGHDMSYLLDVLQEEFEHLKEEINELKEFAKAMKVHRHALDKTYGEKPVW